MTAKGSPKESRMRARDKKIPALARSGSLLALLAGIAAVSAGLGTRYEAWNFRTGLGILRWAAYGGAAAAVLSLAGVISSLFPVNGRGVRLGLAGLVLGLILAAVPWYSMEKAKSVPPIHDITTDTMHPPKFVTILPLRKDASNPPSYGGPQVAAQQRKAYPDIVPLILKTSPDRAFEKALAIARGMGWTIVDDKRDEGRIEATDTTFWFGFKDDIVIRIEQNDSGSRVDIRSVSRVGISDIGTNAARIRRFLAKMRTP
jgi:uncharacterized protein (DUF1499 family)